MHHAIAFSTITHQLVVNSHFFHDVTQAIHALELIKVRTASKFFNFGAIDIKLTVLFFNAPCFGIIFGKANYCNGFINFTQIDVVPTSQYDFAE